MNDKQYTYDIDKYTIGVDENGEDGIGMTIAIIKNGEINFLGNCYGENARCIDLLIKENQELKKHLKVPKACSLKTLKDYKSYYEDTTREQILEDTYIEYCAYVNLAHRYSELKKQLEEYQQELELVRCDLHNRTSERNGYYRNIEILENQQKEFIEYMNKTIEELECEDVDDEEMKGYLIQRIDTFKEILSKYKEIIGGKDEV